MNLETIICRRVGKVATIAPNRPEQPNALNARMIEELVTASGDIGSDDQIGALILPGNDKVFGAGADLKAKPAFALRMIGAAVDAGLDLPLHTALSQEGRGFEMLFSGEDEKEGVQAFVEKRMPVYKGSGQHWAEGLHRRSTS